VSGRRVDARGDGKPLTDNPFTALVEKANELPLALPQRNTEQGSRPQSATPAAPIFAVAKTRKGGWPVSLEKRPGGRVVTVIHNVTGDAQALLSLLRKRCGVGGALRDGTVELQGDQRSKVASFLASLE
jgi:translation initiation factor 1 (eIF-1/SUI1)